MTTATTMIKCPHCHEHSFRIHCLCHRYRCWLEEDEAGKPEAATIIYNNDHITAVRNFAQLHWEEEQVDPTNEPCLDVWISDNGFIERYTVTAATEIVYAVSEVKRTTPLYKTDTLKETDIFKTYNKLIAHFGQEGIDSLLRTCWDKEAISRDPNGAISHPYQDFIDNLEWFLGALETKGISMRLNE